MFYLRNLQSVIDKVSHISPVPSIFLICNLQQITFIPRHCQVVFRVTSKSHNFHKIAEVLVFTPIFWSGKRMKEVGLKGTCHLRRPALKNFAGTSPEYFCWHLNNALKENWKIVFALEAMLLSGQLKFHVLASLFYTD